MKKAFIILGNGFTIDFLKYFSMYGNDNVIDKIDVRNLFRLGDKISPPWENRPGFLSYKACPSLWTLGARPSNSLEESTALIEEVITCANMYFDFINDDSKKQNRLEMVTSINEGIYLKAYSELIVYIRQLFSCYDEVISEEKLNQFVNNKENLWGWLNFFKTLNTGKYNNVIFVTYNYDIWLERILKALNIDFNIVGLEEKANSRVKIIKPHGSISFIHKGINSCTYGIRYALDDAGDEICNFEIKYNDLKKHDCSAIIPPAGESQRLSKIAPWAKNLRDRAREEAALVNANDEVVLCGMSYWHVDRRELDELLINLNQNSNFTFVNPNPPKTLNAVLTSIFKNYVHQGSSIKIGGILNG